MSTSNTVTKTDLENILNEVLPNTSVDYVVEQGTSGDWTYRKWNSGIAECWQTASVTHTIATQRGSWYSSADFTTFTYPFVFVATPTVTATVTYSATGTVIGAQLSSLSTTSVAVRAVANSSLSTSATYLYSVYVIGTWK